MPDPSTNRSENCLGPVQIVLDWFQMFWTLVKEQNSVLKSYFGPVHTNLDKLGKNITNFYPKIKIPLSVLP